MPRYKAKLAGLLHAIVKFQEHNMKQSQEDKIKNILFSTLVKENYIPQEFADSLKEQVIDYDDCIVVRKNIAKQEELKEGERAIIQYVSTRDIDRDGDILVPKGADLSQFKKAPSVLFGHNYSLPPIGSDEWIKADDYGIKAKTIYAEDEFAEKIWQLRKNKHLRTSSVGFIPVERVRPGSDQWDKTVKKYSKLWDVDESYFDDVTGAIYTKWILLEHSDVPVPSNIHALTLEIAKGYKITPEQLKELSIDIPDEFNDDGVIDNPSQKFPTADEIAEALLKKIEAKEADDPGTVEPPEKPCPVKRFVRRVKHVKVIENQKQKVGKLVNEQIEKMKGRLR